MLGSAVVYSGLVVLLAGLVCCVKPMRRFGVSTRARALVVVVTGVMIIAIGFALPAAESRVTERHTRLDEFAPVWQFNEVHTLPVAAAPERVYDAIKGVRADEILFFQTLTWIRRGGRPLPPGILSAASDQSLLDLATKTSFVWLADDPPHELVVGTVIVAPPGTRGKLTPAVFQRTLPPGFVLATMNFVVTPEGGGSRVVTETRVFANSDGVRQRFAAYWRVIYPGSALIRLMWLRAIEHRATRDSNPKGGLPMSRVHALALVTLATTVGVFAQTGLGGAEQEILAVEKQWNEARVKADVAALDRILAADWTVTHGDGTMNTKAEYLADLKSGTRKFFAGVKEDEPAVRLYGDTAIVSGTSESKVEYKGRPSGGALRFTRVYVRRDGRWLMIATHATRRQP